MHLALFVCADSGQQIQSSTPTSVNFFFFQVSLKLCDFFMFLSGFSRSRNSFSRSPSFNKHLRFTLFAWSGSHRHTSLQNPLPEATAVVSRNLHRSASRQQPLDHAVVAILRCIVQRGVASERPQWWLTLKAQRCMVRWYFRSETMPKRWKNLGWSSGHRSGLDWETCSYIKFVSADSEFELPFTHSPMHWPSVWV